MELAVPQCWWVIFIQISSTIYNKILETKVSKPSWGNKKTINSPSPKCVWEKSKQNASESLTNTWKLDGFNFRHKASLTFGLFLQWGRFWQWTGNGKLFSLCDGFAQINANRAGFDERYHYFGAPGQSFRTYRSRIDGYCCPRWRSTIILFLYNRSIDYWYYFRISLRKRRSAFKGTILELFWLYSQYISKWWL